MKRHPLIVITGPTAVGKTKLAVAVASKLEGEIINADSRQVYKNMDVGTGKDLNEYQIDGKTIPFHLIDICEAGYQYNIKEYQEDFTTIYSALRQSQTPAILCGGSGLYIESALKGNPFAFVPIDKALRNSLQDESKKKLIGRISEEMIDKLHITSLTTAKRLIRAVEITIYLKANPSLVYEPKPVDSIIFALKLERRLILERIVTRLKFRLEHGLIEEVENLLNKGLKPEQLLYYGLEYRWITMYVLKEMSYDQMFDRLNIAIRQFAKRQMTWFRRMEKNGYEINWLDGEKQTKLLKEEVIELVNNRQDI